jgi:hypothetical protein
MVEKVTKFNYRQHKTITRTQIDDLYKSIAQGISRKVDDRLTLNAPYIDSTMDKYADMVTTAAIANGWSQKEARAAYNSYLNNHRMIIGVTETNWPIEMGVNTVVMGIDAPLPGMVKEVANLIREGNFSAARTLSDQILALAKMPNSLRQEDVLNELSDVRDRMITPLSQGEALNSMERTAEEMGSSGKAWQPAYYHSRQTHIQAGADYGEGKPIPIDEPFIVGGYPMMYPMDGSYGAPLSEICGCNCVTVFI